MKFLSSNHFSHDTQVHDVLSFLDVLGSEFRPRTSEATRLREAFLKEFPEYRALTWSGSWVDTRLSGVDPDYMGWVCEWIEANTTVYWRDGEPVLPEPGDPEEEGEE